MKIKDYHLPKSFIYTGEHDTIETQINHYQYDYETVIKTHDFKPQDGKRHYIQVIGLNKIKAIQELTKFYPVDGLILEDIFNVTQRPKIEVKDNYLFGVFDIYYLKGNEVKKDYMSILLFNDTLITFHETKPVYLELVESLIEKDPRLKTSTSDYLYYEILDIITDYQLDVYDYFLEQATHFEEDILEAKKVSQENFYIVRKQLLSLKNSIQPTIEHIENKNKLPLISKDHHHYFDDLLDHIKRLDIRLTELRESMRYLLDLYINNQSNTMNKIMTTLTLFSAIFIPLSFLTGFFGMNFVYFEVLEYQHALGFFLAGCVALAVVLILFFKKMKWF